MHDIRWATVEAYHPLLTLVRWNNIESQLWSIFKAFIWFRWIQRKAEIVRILCKRFGNASVMLWNIVLRWVNGYGIVIKNANAHWTLFTCEHHVHMRLAKIATDKNCFVFNRFMSRAKTQQLSNKIARQKCYLCYLHHMFRYVSISIPTALFSCKSLFVCIPVHSSSIALKRLSSSLSILNVFIFLKVYVARYKLLSLSDTLDAFPLVSRCICMRWGFMFIGLLVHRFERRHMLLHTMQSISILIQCTTDFLFLYSFSCSFQSSSLFLFFSSVD